MSEVVIDVEEFLERVQDDKELLFELLEIFLEDFDEKRNSVAEAIKNKDCELLRSVAHSLKGATGNISAKPMRELCIKMETVGKDAEMAGSDNIVSDLTKCYEDLIARIEELKKELV